MPRNYKPKSGAKRYRTYDEQVLKKAVYEYLNTTSSLKEVANKYYIDKSVLYRHSRGTLKKQGGQTVLSAESEEYIVKYINVCDECGYPLDAMDLRFIVKMYLDKLGVKHTKFKNNLPGPDFVASFLIRHKEKVSQRICQNMKRLRAEISHDSVKDYFQELECSLKDIPNDNILNYYEINLADDPGRTTIITKRCTKYPERFMNHSKACVSVMMAGTAAGELLPPYVVYKAQNLYDICASNGPKGARYNRTSSGWFDGKVFEDWIRTIVLPSFSKKSGRKVLIGDNLSSHLSIDTIKLCKEQNISFVFLPANSTHLTQPLDVAFLRPMKTAWRAILLHWRKTDGRQQTRVPKGCFPQLLRILMENIEEHAAANLIAGFRKTGISPISPVEVLSRLPSGTENSRGYKSASEMKYGTMDVREPNRKRKIEVVAGTSVGDQCKETSECASLSSQSNPSIEKDVAEIKMLKFEKEEEVTTKNKGVGKKTSKQGVVKESTIEASQNSGVSSSRVQRNE